MKHRGTEKRNAWEPQISQIAQIEFGSIFCFESVKSAVNSSPLCASVPLW
jgi:hypothetical protein